MEHTTTQQLTISDHSWNLDREEASNCQSFDLQPLILRVVERWNSAAIGYKAMAYAQMDRTRQLSLAKSLRAAEQAIVAVISAAHREFEAGYYVKRMDDLMFALFVCRMLIVLPTARRMAEQDDLGRSDSEIAIELAKRAQFIDGRAVIDQALAADMPSPFKADAVNT